MNVLAVGSVALDSVETPFGRADEALGGSAIFFSSAASIFAPIRLVGVIGDDYPEAELDFLREREVDLGGLVRRAGPSFRWEGRYDYDLNTRETLETELGVFADFEPEIPGGFRDSEMVFLGNIDPELQLRVLDQVDGPRLVACDTMNYWIEGNLEALLDLLGRVDILFLNDAEARELAGEHNLLRASRSILGRGPRVVVVKKGENGAALYADDWIFFAPGYPLEEIFDPTGAGDAFAGGFMGYLAWSGGSLDDEDHLRRAMVYGSAMGSFAVEAFSVDRLRALEVETVAGRVREFREMTSFEHRLPPVEVA